ncbi:MAG TPA: asparaginase [Candidatus Marinimicrobia bacterium]|jgi:N4-(beta-N-acetylglucosaminyl)-L-asparaginase|nr:asparaginase [Candidatus Neomarinimicrobiota bacterium]HIB71306.1 asparaginase [Candidatus Neomarinimicrobiota bacterium]HIO75267.1 asparaginase [Candidatus Neomarinimicrobiota bacterium]HIO88268.1 asparaginase [Candidatus Neomarinimicrobiota bacterium]
MINRRKFIKTLSAFGISLPVIGSGAVTPKPAARKNNPVILCSRGESWGKKVLTPGWEILSQKGSLLDAVEKSANVTELDPEDTSVGYGGLPNERGVVQLDSSIMFGPTHNCGSVAALEGIKTPCSVARLVMERTDHIHIVGKGAQDFAVAHGFKVENLLTEKSRKIWLRWKENLSDKDDWFPPKDGDYDIDRTTGTINVLAVDSAGDLAGITTTSGLAWKIPGRIGDSPIIGAGLFVDNEVGAVGATGRGEELLRSCGSFYGVEQMRAGKSPQEACEAVCQRIIDINGGKDKVDFSDKMVAMNKDGEVGCAAIRGSKGKEPEVAYWSKKGFKVLKGTYLIES